MHSGLKFFFSQYSRFHTLLGTGLLDVFKNKLHCSVTSPPVLVSVRFTYVLTEWPHTLWTQQPPDFDATLTEVGFSDLGKLPFGALSDPIR